MDIQVLWALIAFAFVSSITPGPNNLMLMASGANFGFARTIPHMLGVGIGFVFMVVVVGAGLAQLFDAFPASYDILKAVSILYLLYLAYKIATSAPPEERTEETGKPFTFTQAALFQWVNPKAWAMALTASAVYAPSHSLLGVTIVAVVFGLVNIPSVGAWAALGAQMQRVLTDRTRLRAFNWTMAALLVLSLYPVLFP
jgi:threonine/homoserine/homoserine lactone efflux protein